MLNFQVKNKHGRSIVCKRPWWCLERRCWDTQLWSCPVCWRQYTPPPTRSQNSQPNIQKITPESYNLNVHKYEIILNFFWPKSKPYMPLVNFQKKFDSFPSIFARISMFEHISRWLSKREIKFFWSAIKKFSPNFFTLVL